MTETEGEYLDRLTKRDYQILPITEFLNISQNI